MANPEPIKMYLEAQKYKRNKKLATDFLLAAVGAPPANPLIKANIDKFLDSDSLPGEIMLKLVASEAAKKVK